MYNLKNRNKGVKLGLITAFFALLIGCLIAFVSNPFSVAEKANADAQTPEYNGISAQSAADMEAAWNAAVASNGTFTLTEDWVINQALTVESGVNLVLDLNGHTIDRGLSGYLYQGEIIKVNGTLTIKDSVGGGKLTHGSGDDSGAVTVNNGGNLTLESGEISGNFFSNTSRPVYCGSVYVSRGATFTMNGGLITDNSIEGNVIGGGVVVYGAFTMNGGEIRDIHGGLGGTGVIVNGGDCMLKGGTITNLSGTQGGIFGENGKITLAGSNVYNIDGLRLSGAADITVLSKIDDYIEYRGSDWRTWNKAVKCSVDNNIQIRVYIRTNWSLSNNIEEGIGYKNGAMYVPAGADILLDLNGSTINRGLTEETAVAGGNVICIDGGKLELTDSRSSGTITGGADTYGAGGGVRVENGGTFIMNGGTISGNYALDLGGGVYVTESTFIMNGGTISDNKSNYGGGVEVEVFDKAMTSDLFVMNGGTISNNTASEGGGVYVSGNDFPGNMSMYGGTISDNTADGYSPRGGGVFVGTNGVFTMIGGEISGNYAALEGGGVCLLNDDSIFTMEGGTITNNSAMENGAGVCVNRGEFTMKDGTISNNTNTGYDGAGVYVYSFGTFTLLGGTITGNTAGSQSGSGGGVWSSGKFSMSGGTISNNRATQRSGLGGGVYIMGSPNGAPVVFEMTGGTISGNSAGLGGGVYVTMNGQFIMNSGNIVGNSTIVHTNNGNEGNGGGVYIDDGSSFVMNGGVIDGNTAANSGGGVYVKDAGVSVRGGEITYNTARCGYQSSDWSNICGGGGVFVDGGGNLDISAGDISYNTVNNGTGGGVQVGRMTSGVTFSMSGGTITNNTADSTSSTDNGWAGGGGGIYFLEVDSPIFSGGEITYNRAKFFAGGIASYYGMVVSGDLKVYNNYDGLSGNQQGNVNFVYPDGTNVITIQGYNLAGNGNAPYIGISNYARTDGVVVVNVHNIAYTDSYNRWFFTDDNSQLYYSLDDNNLSFLNNGGTPLPVPTVTLTWQYRMGSGSWSNMSNGQTIAYTGNNYEIRAMNGSSAVTITDRSYKDLSGMSLAVIRNAGVYTVAVTGTSYRNPTVTLNVSPKYLSITWSNNRLTYTGMQQYPVPTLNGVIAGDSVSPVCNTANAGVQAGKYSVNVTGLVGADVNNYKLDNAVETQSISYEIFRAQLAKPTASGSFNYNGTEQTYNVGGFNSTLMTLGGTYAATNAGDYTATVSIKDTKNYEWIDGSVTPVNIGWTINKLHIFVGGISVANKEYDGTTAATVDESTAQLLGIIEGDRANLGLTFTAGSEFDSAAVGLRSVTVTGIALTGSAAGNYILDFDEVTRYAQIYPATVTISGVVANGREYDGTTGVTFNADGATITGAFAGELSGLTVITSGYFSSKNVGTGVEVTVTGYRLDGEFAGNYIVDFENSEKTLTANITPAQVEVTFGASEYTVTYGNGLKITFSQNSPVKSESVSLALEYWDEFGNSKLDGVPTDAGKYLVKVVVDDSDPNLANYTVKRTGEGLISEASVTIEKASLTVTVEDKTIEYGAAKPADGDYILIYNGWLNGDKAKFEGGEITFVQAIVISTDYEQGNNAGTYAITLADGELKNYEITYVNGVLTVAAKKVTVTIDDKSSEYGDSDVELTSDGADDMQITLTRAAGTAVGKYAITGVSANTNYDVTFIDGVYEITKARLTVTANGAEITYGDVAKSDGATYAGFKNGEDESVLSGSLAFRYTYTQYGDIFEADGVTAINYYIIPYGVTADNYDIEFVNGLLTINKKEATVTVSNAASDITSVIADREEAAKTVKYTVSGTVNGDDLIVTLAIAASGTNRVGNATEVVSWPAVGVYDVTGTFANANYAVRFVYENGEQKGTYTISQGTLIITANTLILSYGEEVAFGADWDEAVTAEGLPAGATLKSLIESHAISGSLTVVAFGDAAYNEYTAMGSAYRLGDDIFDASGNRINYIVIPTGLSSSSYNIIFRPGKLMIEPKSIVVTLDNKSSVYGAEDEELTASVEAGALVNFGSGSVVDFLGVQGLTRAAGSDAGNYAITATGATNKNYRITFVNGVYTIEQYVVTLVWEVADKYTYNGLAQSPVATFAMPDGTVYKSTDTTDKFIEVTGSGVNAGSYKAQAFLLNNNLKFADGTDTAKGFTIDQKQLGVKWYKDADDIGDESKAIAASSTVSTPVKYDYRVGHPYAPVVELSGIEAVDNGANFYYVSGEQSAVNVSGAYKAVLHILNANYKIATDDTDIYFVIVKSAPAEFAWYENTDFATQITSLKEYTYNGEVQHPVAKALGDEEFVYTIYDVTNGGEKLTTSTIGVGSYKIVATPVNGNLELSAEAATFYFDIVAMDVTSSLTWSATSFEYNGSEQVPTAYYVDAQGQKVYLTVNGDRGVNANENGSVYNVSVTLDTKNYKFVVDGEDTQTFEATYTITAKEIKVSWSSKYTDEDGNFKWEMVYNGETQTNSIEALAEMLNSVENVGLNMTVWYQADENDTPVQVNDIRNAGRYTLRVALAEKTPNYSVTDAEQYFTITRKQLSISADDKEVNTGATAPVLTAKFDGFAENESAESLGLDAGGWLTTNYDLSSPYVAESEYTSDTSDLKTLADLNAGGYVGYFIVLTDSEARLAELNAKLSNYDWSFTSGKMVIIAVEGDVSIILTQAYNGNDQTPAAKYKAGNNWIDLKVEVYTDETYSEKVENPEVKNVGKYYVLLKKYSDDNVTLEGAETSGEFAGCVKKVFTITEREIEIRIGDKTRVYGEITEGNYTEYLAGLWAYASNDALYQPLAGDELEISLNVSFVFDGAGFAVVKKDGDRVTGYEITGSWSEDETLRNNYKVLFVGSQGESGLFTITKAGISFYEKTGEYNQVIEQNDSMRMALAEMQDGAYKYFSFAGNQAANVEIYYSMPYSLDNNNPDSFLPENDVTLQNKLLTIAPDFIRTGSDSRYFVNFMIVIANHETYYGQWTAEVLYDTVYIRILFVKEYGVTYGESVPEGKELADALWNGGYIDKNATGIQNMFQQYIDNDIVTARVVADKDGLLDAGAYTIVFEGLENVSDGKYEVTYKQNVNDNGLPTNVNKYVVARRNITLTWDKTSFEYDGKAHLPTPGIEGWNLVNSASVNGATVYSFADEATGATLNLTVKTNGGDFTTVGSENIVIAEIEDNNYALDSFNATRAVSILNGDIDGGKPAAEEGGVPVAAIIALAVCLGVAVMLILILAVVLKKRKVAAYVDEDGFNDPADVND